MKVRHWWIQKHKYNNMPSKIEGAVFEEFMPTTHLKDFEWIKVISLDDFKEKLKKDLAEDEDENRAGIHELLNEIKAALEIGNEQGEESE